MEVQVKVNSKVTVVADGKNPMEVFQNLSALQEVFGEEKCGKCEGTNFSFRVRKAKDGKKEYLYPEIVCHSHLIETNSDGIIKDSKKLCYAKLAFGQSDDGILFPIRFKREGKEYVKDTDGKNIPKGSNGWVRFNFEKKLEE